MKIKPITPILLYAKTVNYTKLTGQTTSWVKIVSGAYDTFYCEWQGGFGDRAIAAQSIGVKDFATIRTFFNPIIYEKLRTVQVVVIKNADATAIVSGNPDKNNPNVYELWGGVDNVKEENQFMEFKVRRFEGL